MQSFNVLDPHTSVLGYRCLEASAGTGKTFTIEHLVSRLILEENLKLEEILIVTFTRAATRDLKARIRANLEKKGMESTLACFDQAQIFTIHGFCHRMLSEYAFDMTDPEDQSYQGLMREEVKDFFRTQLHLEKFSSTQLEALLSHHKNDADQIIEELVRLIEENLENSPDFIEYYQRFLEKIKTLSPVTFEELELLASLYKGMKEPQAELKLLAQIIEKQSCSLEEFEELIGLEGFENLKVRAKPIQLSDSCRRVQQEILPLLFEIKDPLKTLLKMAYECQQRWKSRIVNSPDEILNKMEQNLQNPQFQQKVRERYRAVIVDEFQDTDPIQWRIFQQAFMGHVKAFYIIGDPKQAIYGFRRADIYTYLDASQVLSEKYALTTNYRSTSRLIDDLNHFFALAPWIELPHLAQNLTYQPVASANTSPSEKGLHFLKVEDEESLFAYIANEVDPNKKTALLIKDRFQAQRLYQYLKKLNITAVIGKGCDLTETPEFYSLEAIFTAIEDPTRLKAALASPLIGWTSQQILSDWIIMKPVFADFQNLGIGAFFQKFLHTFQITPTVALRQLIEILLQKHSPLKALQELKKETIEVNEEQSNLVIMTTHASKGLEFDVVFAIGMAFGRKSKEKWLRLKDKIIDANSNEAKLALQEQEAEKLRQLYVALTRAKEQVFLPYIAEQTESPFSIFLNKANSPCLEYIEIDPNLKPRVREISAPSCIQSETPPVFAPQMIMSFSSLAQKKEKSSYKPPSENDLPAGTETGTLVHRIFEKIFEGNLHHPFNHEKIQALISKETDKWANEILSMVTQALHQPLDGFALIDVPQVFQEMEFLFPDQNNHIKGFADLCFTHKGKYYFLDWKTNWLGPDPEDYSPEKLHKAMEENDYFLQASLYKEALSRYVKLFSNPPLFGGAFYYFLRNHKLFRIN